MATSQESSADLCCLIQCVESAQSKIIQPGSSRVDVRAFEPKSKKGLSAVSWRPGGVARFHRSCWKTLVAASKGANSTSWLLLSEIEKSMITEASKTAEYHDSESTLKSEASRIAAMLKQCRYCIGFTGAGISTAAGIGDFRGIHGKWTEREKEKNYGAGAGKRASNRTSMENLRPTYTHEALVKLMEMGILKFLISQNTDGLHRLSGIPGDKIAELHGNSFVERCEDCPARYERKHACRQASSTVVLKCPKCHINHRTGRECTVQGCGGQLMNTIINFGDYLESDVLHTAEHEGSKADCVLVLGSTLRVTPANQLVTKGEEPHHIIICNRQTTPYDNLCHDLSPAGQRLGSRVYGDCDRLMMEVMRQLLPPQELQAWENGRSERMKVYDSKRS